MTPRISRSRGFPGLSDPVVRRYKGRRPLRVAAPAPDDLRFLLLDGLLFHPLARLGRLRFRPVLGRLGLSHIGAAGLGLLPLVNGSAGLIQSPASSRADGGDRFPGVLFHLFLGGYSGAWLLFLPPFDLFPPVAVLHQFPHAPGSSAPDGRTALFEKIIFYF